MVLVGRLAYLYRVVAWGGVVFLEVDWFDYLLIPDIKPFTPLILRHWANCGE